MTLHPPDRPADPPGPRDPSRSPDKRRTRDLPHYKLILHSGGPHDLMSVVRTIMELTRFCRAEATHKMWEAYHSGRSVLLVTYRERAELFAEQFGSKGIPIVIEPA